MPPAIDCGVPRCRFASSLLLLLTITLTCANGLPIAMDPIGDSSAEAALLEATNRARARHGVPPLEMAEGLARAARSHAEEMARLRYFSHASPTPENSTLLRRLARAGVPHSQAGENLALLREATDVAEGAVRGWLASPSHRAALLRPEYTHVGFGLTEDSDGETLVAQVFARRPRELRRVSVGTEQGDGYELTVSLEVPRRLAVLPRLAGTTGEVLQVEPGRSNLTLHTDSALRQQLVLGIPVDGRDHYLIQDGGWITPADGSWVFDLGMPRKELEIIGVGVRPVREQVVRIELDYEPSSSPLAVFVSGRHYRDAEAAPGELRLFLPAAQRVVLQVGEVAGSTVEMFDSFTVLPTPEGPRLLAGTVP